MAADKPFSEALTMALSEALSEPHSVRDYVHNDERAAGAYGMSAGLSAIQLVAAGMNVTAWTESPNARARQTAESA